MIDGGEAIRKPALNVARFTGGVGAILMLHRATGKPVGVTTPLANAGKMMVTV